MPRNLEHLELAPWKPPVGRRSKQAAPPPTRDHHDHGDDLIQQAEQMSHLLVTKRQTAPAGINPKLIFKLILHPNGHIAEANLGDLGLRLLACDSQRAIVVFPDEATLDALRARLSEYAGYVPNGRQSSFIAAIDRIVDIEPEDRIGQTLRVNPLAADEVAALDIDIWHSGNQDECRQWIGEIAHFLAEQSLRITDSWTGDSLCLVRAQVNERALSTLLTIDYIREIDRRARPSFEMWEVARLGVEDVNVQSELPDDLVGVLVVDSGVMQRHPILGPALGDAQVFPGRMRERIIGGAEDGDEIFNGHGTAVAGIAAYNDIGQCIEQRNFEASALIFSARVTDDQNEYDEDDLLEHQLSDAVNYFLENYPQVKVINISLGDSRLVYSEGNHQFRFAAAIDAIAYQYRDRQVVFVVSAGNAALDELTPEELVRQYPSYLLNSPTSRIIDPATSALALTVGGLSYGAGQGWPGREGDIDRLIATERGWPSSFTRCGLGFDGAIKPDVVDFAGDMRFERGHIARSPNEAGVPTTAKNFAPPDGRLFRTVSGTSFAAPRVANLAARLFREFPEASANLIRALIVDSARIPQNRPASFMDRDHYDLNMLRVYGYGQPCFERARWSDQNEVLLIADSSMLVDTVQIYNIPSLPREFLEYRGNGYISVTLAFNPPTRHSRSDSYLGIRMEFKLFRNVSPDSVVESIRDWNEQERKEKKIKSKDLPKISQLRREDDPPIDIQYFPNLSTLKKGTLQRGVVRISGQRWAYNGDPIVLALTCKRKWAPPSITDQPYAVVVSLIHENPDLQLYSTIRQQARLYQRVRIRI